jgi:type IV secretion system protein VirD4
MIFNPSDVGWHLGRAQAPRGGALWVPWDRTTGVIGPQGSGKTLDLLIPALFKAPGAALVTLTKVDELLLSFRCGLGMVGPVWYWIRSV